MSNVISKILLYSIKLVLIVLPLVLILWLVGKDLVISGQLQAVYGFDKLSPFISTFRPQSRVEEPQKDEQGNYWQQITDEPVYFDMRLPRSFDRADVSIKFKNIDQPIFELGLLADNKNWIFDLKPVLNSVLDNLFANKLNWVKLESDDLVLFQKDKNYDTIDEFLNDLPTPEKIATYNYVLGNKFILPGYFPASSGIEINKSLRGEHRLLTYIKNETLNFSFLIQDVNRNIGEDYLDISIFNEQGDLVYTDFIKDDGNISDDGKMSETALITIEIPDLPEGLYRLELKANNDDIFFRQIKTTQSLLVFINSVYLGDEVGFDDYVTNREVPTSLYTNGFEFTAYTSHKEGLQSIGIGDEVLRVVQTHTNFDLTNEFGKKFVVSSKNDVKLTTNGLFSFSKDAFFNPLSTSLKLSQEFDQDVIGYVIARYQPPVAKEGSLQKTVSFDNLNNYYHDDDMLHFVLSLPAIEEGDEGVILDKVEVVLTRQPNTWKNLFNKLKARYLNFYE